MTKTAFLTPAMVDAIRPDPTGRREVSDGAGLWLIVQPSGAKTWVLRYRNAEGRQRKLHLGRCVSKHGKRTAGPVAPGAALTIWQARAKAGQELATVKDAARDPAAERAQAKAAAKARADGPDRHSVAAVYARYLRQHVEPRGGAPEMERVFRVDILPRWRERLIESISEEDVVELVDAVVERGAPIAANRVLAYARAFFSWAKGRRIIKVNPAAGIAAPSAETSRDRVLDDREITLLWKATERLGAPFGPMYRMLLLTGARLREVAEMTDRELVEDEWTLKGARTKNGRPHILRLPELARQTLAAVPRGSDGGYLFSTTEGSRPVSGFGHAKARLDRIMAEIAAAEAGEPVELEPFRVHDLRRTAASGMARIGIAPHVIEAVLNHQSGVISGVAGIYNRFAYTEEKSAALAAWARFVAGLVEGRNADNVVPLMRADAPRA